MDIIPVFGTVVGGSNPSESTRVFPVGESIVRMETKSGHGLVVERVLAKDEMRVRFSLLAQLHILSVVVC